MSLWTHTHTLWTGLEIAWQASLLALLLMLMVALMRKGPAPLRYGLLLVALVKFALPVIPAPAGLFPWLGERLDWSSQMAVTTVIPAASARSGMTPEAVAAAIPSTLPSPVPWTGILFGLYGAGVLVCLGRLGWQRYQLWVWTSRSRAVDDAKWIRLYRDVAAGLKMRRVPRLWVSEEIETPAAFGLWKPSVVLPQSVIEGLDEDEMRAVLAHELAHHKRFDLWVLTAQRFLAAIWWFNPIYFWLDRSLNAVREECCDDLVIASGSSSRRAYCRALLRSADLCVSTPGRVPALAWSGAQPSLARRMTRIMDRTWRQAARLGTLGTVLVLAVAVVALPGRAELSLEPGQPDADLQAVQLRALSELQIRQAWPQIVFEHLAALEHVSINGVRYSKDVFELDLSSPQVIHVASLMDQALNHLSRSDLHELRQTSDGVQGLVSLVLETGSKEGESFAELESPEPPDVERARLAERLLLTERDAESTLQQIRAIFAEASVEPNAVDTPARLDRGLYSEWPLVLQLDSETIETDLLMRLATVRGVLVERIDRSVSGTAELELRLLKRAPGGNWDSLEPTGPWRYSESLGRLRRLAADMGC